MSAEVIAALIASATTALGALVLAVRSRRSDKASASVQETTATLNALEIAERATRIANEADIRSRTLEADHRQLERRVADLALSLAECEHERRQIAGLRARVRDLETRTGAAERRNGA